MDANARAQTDMHSLNSMTDAFVLALHYHLACYSSWLIWSIDCAVHFLMRLY